MAAAIHPTRPRTRSARSGAAPFFQVWPPLLDPVMDGSLIAFDGPSCGSLPGPLQLLTQQVPDVARVIGHTGHAVDHLSHAWQRPHISGVAERDGPSY